MCRGNYKKHSGVGAVGSDNEMIMYAIGGGVASAFVVNPIVKAIFKVQKGDTTSKEALKAAKYAPAVKAVLGYLAMTQSDDERIQSMGFGALVVGGVEALQAAAPTVFSPKGLVAVEGIGEVIDLNAEEFNGIDDPYAVGSAGDAYAVSGGVS